MADMLATFGETSGECALKRMKLKMENDEVGRQILKYLFIKCILS